MKVIGIDPGKTTGLAVYVDGELTLLSSVQPIGLAAWLQANAISAVVAFEDSRLISPTWSRGVKSVAATRKIARDVGQIDAWCTQIEAICASLGIQSIPVSPRQKGAKLNASEFAALLMWPGRTNEHERDAAMVAYPFRRMRASTPGRRAA